MSQSSRDAVFRLQVAEAAARIMWEESVSDYGVAKRKAATRLGFTDTRALPSNVEVEQAWQSYQALFHPQQDDQVVAELCASAVLVMRQFSEFNPHIAGECVTGQSSPNPTADIHLFSGSPKEIAFHLMDLQLPVQSVDREVRMPGNVRKTFPGFDLDHDHEGENIRLTVFPQEGIHQVPRRSLDGRAMQRLSLADFELHLSEMQANARPSA